MRKAAVIGCVGFCMVALVGGDAFGADRYWVGLSGTWSDGTKWNTKADGTGVSGVPQSNDQVYIRLPGDTNNTVSFDTDQAVGVSLGRFELDSLGGFTGYFYQTRGSLSAGSEAIGITGSAAYRQTGGTNSVVGDLTLAQGSGSTGSYYLSSGSLAVTGNLTGGAGQSFLHLNGGAIDVGGAISASELYVDANVGATSFYNLGTAPHVTARRLVVGGTGTTTLEQNGGTTSVISTMEVIGYGWPLRQHSATYRLTGGTLNNGGSLTIGAPAGNPNYTGSAAFQQTGGIHTVSGEVSVGAWGGVA